MKIVLSPYSSEWKSKYQLIEREVEQVLSHLNPHIEHIGSTSINGLMAKPIVDVMIGLESEAVLDIVVQPLQAIGYSYNKTFEGELPLRGFFNKVIPKDDEQIPQLIDGDFAWQKVTNICNVHIVPICSNWWQRHLVFRNYLRENIEMKLAYQSLKQDLAKQDWEHTYNYAEAKNDFIRKIEKEAGFTPNNQYLI